jgi:hypothetical protein
MQEEEEEEEMAAPLPLPLSPDFSAPLSAPPSKLSEHSI